MGHPKKRREILRSAQNDGAVWLVPMRMGGARQKDRRAGALEERFPTDPSGTRKSRVALRIARKCATRPDLSTAVLQRSRLFASRGENREDERYEQQRRHIAEQMPAMLGVGQ